MGLIEELFGKTSRTAVAGEEVLIPEHRRKEIEAGEAREKDRIEKEKREAVERKRQEVFFVGTKPLFEIADLFSVGGISMLKGRVLKGRIKPRSKIVSGKKRFVITEVWKNNQRMQLLLQGEHGTLFLNQLKGFHHRVGDIVQIE